MKKIKKAKQNLKPFSLQRRVMEQIHSEKITPVSMYKLLFVRLLWWAIIIAFFLLTIFFVSLFIDKLTIPKIMGFKFVLQNFPWFSGGLSLSFLLLTFSLIEIKRVFYKWSLTFLFLMLAGSTLVFGFFLHKTNIHVSGNKALGQVYKIDGEPLEIAAGNVLEVRTNRSFVFRSLWGARFNVYLNQNVELPKNKLEEKDSILIVGTKEGGIFYAKGIVLLSRVEN